MGAGSTLLAVSPTTALWLCTVAPEPERPVRAGITLHEGARRLGCSYKTLWRLAHAGRLPHYRVGRALRLDPDLIDQIKASGGLPGPGGAAAGRAAAALVGPPRPRRARGRFARLAQDAATGPGEGTS